MATVSTHAGASLFVGSHPLASFSFSLPPRPVTYPSEQQRRIIELEDRVGSHNYHPLPVVLSKGAGPHVWDVDGKQYVQRT